MNWVKYLAWARTPAHTVDDKPSAAYGSDLHQDKIGDVLDRLYQECYQDGRMAVVNHITQVLRDQVADIKVALKVEEDSA